MCIEVHYAQQLHRDYISYFGKHIQETTKTEEEELGPFSDLFGSDQIRCKALYLHMAV
jgi:hypothetical protein